MNPGDFKSLLRRLSIRQKLMFITMASSAAAILLMAGAFLMFEYSTFRSSMQRDLSTLAAITGDQSSAALRFGDKDGAREILDRLQVKPGIEAASPSPPDLPSAPSEVSRANCRGGFPSSAGTSTMA